MNKFLKVAIIIISVPVLILFFITLLDFVNKSYFLNSENSFAACYNNCFQYVCEANVSDESTFVCMNTSKFSDKETAQEYFDKRKEELENSQLKNADCFYNEPILYKKCSILDRTTELNTNIKTILNSDDKIGRILYLYLSKSQN